MIKLLIATLLLSNLTYSMNALHREIESDLYTAEPIYTGAQGLKLVNKLLRANFNITQSDVNRINVKNSSRIIKMREYDETLAKYKYIVLTESIKKKPNHAKLDLVYEQINELREDKRKMWVSIKNSIWDILDVKHPVTTKRAREKDTMGSLRW